MKRIMLLCLLLLAACTPAAVQQPTEVVAAAPTPVSQIRTPRPTWTIIATNTPVSATATLDAATSAPSATPTATPTATATHTPSATATPTATPSRTPVMPSATATAELIWPPPPTASPAAEQVWPVATETPQSTATPPKIATQTPAAATATATPAAAPTQSTLTIGALANLADGRQATIRGAVVASASFSHGFKLTVADESGRIVLLLWHDVYDDCWACPGLNVGATVEVTGEVNRFEGELQIEPQWGGAVKTPAPAYAFAPKQAVNELANYFGQRVMIEGDIVRVDVAEQFTKLFVNDGSGEIEVFVWNNVWQRVPNRDSLIAGRRVRVVGIIGEFRGTRQLQPALPVDIVLL